jgi:hypothetical protein
LATRVQLIPSVRGVVNIKKDHSQQILDPVPEPIESELHPGIRKKNTVQESELNIKSDTELIAETTSTWDRSDVFFNSEPLSELHLKSKFTTSTLLILFQRIDDNEGPRLQRKGTKGHHSVKELLLALGKSRNVRRSAVDA